MQELKSGKTPVLLFSIVVCSLLAPSLVSADSAFVRGDINSDGRIDSSDALAGLNFLFLGKTIACVASADVNDDESVDLSDSVHVLLYLFLGRSEPPPPFPRCGVDPTPSSLECATFPACDQDTSTEFVSADGNLTITVPEGVLPEGVQLQITTATDFPDARILGAVYEVGPEGTIFSEPVSFAIKYAGQDVPDPSALRVATVEDGKWVALDDPVVDAVAQTVSGTVTHLSPFAILDTTPPVDPGEPGTTGDFFRLQIDENPEVLYNETIDGAAPLGHDPYVGSIFDTPRVESTRTPITLKQGSTGGGPYQQIMRLEFAGQTPGIYLLDGDQATAFYVGEDGIFGGDDGTLATGGIDVERFDEERIAGTFNLRLCPINELAEGNCNAGGKKFSGSFDVSRESVVPVAPLPDLICRIRRVEADYARKETTIHVDVVNIGPLESDFTFDLTLGFWFFDTPAPENPAVPDVEVANIVLSSLRLGGGSVTLRVTLPWEAYSNLPGILPLGPASLLARVDTSDVIKEGNDFNNTSPVFNWDLRRIDLTTRIDRIKATDMLLFGHVVDIGFTVINRGDIPVELLSADGKRIELNFDICMDWDEDQGECRGGRATVSDSLQRFLTFFPVFIPERKHMSATLFLDDLPASGVARVTVSAVGATEKSLDDNASLLFPWTSEPFVDLPAFEILNFDRQAGLQVSGFKQFNQLVYAIHGLTPGETYKISLSSKKDMIFSMHEGERETMNTTPIMRCRDNLFYRPFGTVSSQINNRVACPFTATAETHSILITGGNDSRFTLSMEVDRTTDVAITLDSVDNISDEPTLTYTLHNLGARDTGERSFHVDLWLHRHPENELLEASVSRKRAPDTSHSVRTSIPAGGSSIQVVSLAELERDGVLDSILGGIGGARVGDDTEWPDPDRDNNQSPALLWGEQVDFRIDIVSLQAPAAGGDAGRITYLVTNLSRSPRQATVFDSPQFCLDLHKFQAFPWEDDLLIENVIPNYPWGIVCGPLAPGQVQIIIDAPIDYFEGSDGVYLGLGLQSHLFEASLSNNLAWREWQLPATDE